MRILIIFIFAAVLFTSCGKKDDKTGVSGDTETKKTAGENNSQQKNDTKTESADEKPGNTVNNKNPELKWDFKVIDHGKYDEPITQVSLIVNGISHSIEKIDFSFNEITREGYGDFSIPEDALTACRGWWAGAGIDYWVIKKENSLAVYSRELGESMSDDGEPDGYMDKPKLLKTIKQ